MSDRFFGLIVLMVALGFIASATQIQTSFLSDPVGPKAFPIMVGAVAALCGLVMMIKPDPSPTWPKSKTLGALVVAVLVLVAYAYALKPLGFILPTALAAAVLSYQICARGVFALLTGIGLAIGLFLLFKFALGLGLVAFPPALGM